ncbi:MAG: DUF6279 family lipoprotein [Bdellovibrionota bacterium]
MQGSSNLKVFFLLLAMGLVSCSRVQLIYDYGDWLLERSLNKSLELKKDKKKELSIRVKDYFKEHRKTELPRWSYFLYSTADLIEKSSPTDAKIKDSVNDLENLLKRSLLLGVPSFSELLISLNETEVSRLERNFQKENSEQLEELSEETEREYREERFDRIQDRIEFFIDELKAPQKQIIREFVADFDYPNRSLWVQNRAHQQARFIAFLKKRPSLKELEAYFEDQIQRPEKTRLPDYQKQIETAKKRFYLFAQKLSESLDSKQKAFFVERLKSLAGDFKSLATES